MTPYWLTGAVARGSDEPMKNDRYNIAGIGTGDRWMGIIGGAMKYGDVVAVCDVDREHVEKAREKVGGKAEMFEDYRKVLDRPDIDVVIIGTPDHWHSKISIEAMLAGKDVYCEKPLTLTIDEGKKICQVQKQTGRVFQVGTQQRSEFSTDKKEDKHRFHHQFLHAVALAHSGALGKIQRVTCSLGDGPVSESLPQVEVPKNLNWDMWLGQAPWVEYVQGGKDPDNRFPQSRCHYNFRWWYEYSGGKLTDWGAHHIDIAQWVLGMDQSGPLSIEATAELPVSMKDGFPTLADRYNTASTYYIKCVFPNDAVMVIREGPDNGVWIEGDKGEIFVNRGKLKDVRGDAVAKLQDEPLPEEAILKLCKGKKPGSHMGNFFECIGDRSMPISDVHTHHRCMTTAHLANIAIRLDRPLKWDPEREQMLGDEQANAMQSREQRQGYEIKV
jgi:predicted dehydrogenase